ncbi:MAG: oligosaccharide flippase family protein, partial [Muribaculaceae bacterium]|nr:oligosaccharide flippase family protein [Muribaculaceae bacterium]
GYYTQADKWSKMGTASLSQILTSSFLAPLSAVQDDQERFNRLLAKMNRFTAYVLFPSFVLLIVMATPIFHLLFGTKWDPSIPLFQLLLLRGIFTVISSLYSNYILALGKAKMLVAMEILRDGVAIAAIIATLPFISLSTPTNAIYGIEILLWGQVGASALTCLVTMAVVARYTRRSLWLNIFDNVPYIALTLVAAVIPFFADRFVDNNIALLAVQAVAGFGIYFLLNKLFNSKIQKEAIDYFASRWRKKSPNK